MPAVAAVLVTMLVVSPSRADDAVFGGQGVNLIPLQETRVRMVSEDVLLEQVKNPDYDADEHIGDATRHWRVEAVYRFENPTDQRLALQMGFPEQRCTDGCFRRRGAFRDLSTTVRGQPVPQREGKVSLGDRWSRNLGRVFVYDVEFAPRESLEVVHRYTFDASVLVSGEVVDYVTQTGRLWADPIGRARFTIQPLNKPWIAQVPPEYRLISFTHMPCERSNEDPARRANTEFVFEMHDWTPREDLLLHLIQDDGCASGLLGLKCACCDEELRGQQDSPLCAAMVLARHGKTFDDPALSERFYTQPRQFDEEAEWCLWDWGDSFQKIWLAPNPHYADSMLSDVEREQLQYFGGAPIPIADDQPASDQRACAPHDETAPGSAAPPPPARPTSGCGHCAVGTARGDRGGSVASLIVLLAGTYRRSRRRDRDGGSARVTSASRQIRSRSHR